MEGFKTYKLNNWKRLVIWYNEGADSPREQDNIWKLCIRKYRNYNFPNELKFDFDLAIDEEGFDEQEKELKPYYFFALDCYEHWGIVFSLAWSWMQCQFDTSEDCGFIAIPKISEGVGEITKEQALSYAEDEIKMFNQYLNWEVYRYVIQESVKRTSEDWRVRYEFEYEDWGCGYYDIKDILDEFKEYEPVEID